MYININIQFFQMISNLVNNNVMGLLPSLSNLPLIQTLFVFLLLYIQNIMINIFKGT